jgi:hypothetical protein
MLAHLASLLDVRPLRNLHLLPARLLPQQYESMLVVLILTFIGGVPAMFLGVGVCELHQWVLPIWWKLSAVLWGGDWLRTVLN